MKKIALVLTLGLFLAGCHVSTPRAASPPTAEPSRVRQLPPLIAAAAAGEPEVVRHLLDEGADINQRCAVPHDRTALEAAIWHRQNDIDRITAVPNDPGGEFMRNQPVDGEGFAKDEDYREVIGMLREAAREAKLPHAKRHK